MLAVVTYSLLLFVIVAAQEESTLSNSSIIPSCSSSNSSQFRISLLAQGYVPESYAISSKQGAINAADILNVSLNWIDYNPLSGKSMKESIIDIVDNGADGLIVTIPDQPAAEGVQYALSKQVAVIVYNNGLGYATELGLTRVLQDNTEAGRLLGKQLVDHGFSKPLVLNMDASLGDFVEDRMNGLAIQLGSKPAFVSFNNVSSTALAVNMLRNMFVKNGTFDSIVSLGGGQTTDVVASTVTELVVHESNNHVGAGFFDPSGAAVNALFYTYKNTWGISQLPYYQTLLPMFYCYIQLVTDQSVYGNQTINTGPTLITNATLSAFNESNNTSLETEMNKSRVVGAILNNVNGDTYNDAVMAGAQDLVQKLNWTITNAGQSEITGDNDTTSKDQVNNFILQGVYGLFIQTSDPDLINYSVNASNNTSTEIALIGDRFESLSYPPLDIASSVAVDTDGLASAVAKGIVNDNVQRPLCLAEYNPWLTENLCEMIYHAYADLSSDPVANIDNVVHEINISTDSATDTELTEILNSLTQDNYNPDAFITFSDYVFKILNAQILDGTMSNSTPIYTSADLISQCKDFLGGHIKQFWYLNTFAMGFLSILNIFISRYSVAKPWLASNISTPNVQNLCQSGYYYTELSSTLYCSDTSGNVHRSFQCHACANNTYSSYPDQSICTACPDGMYSLPGETHCMTCGDDPDHGSESISCVNYASNQASWHKRMYLAVFLSIFLSLFAIIAAFLIWRYLKRRKRLRGMGDDTWVLSYRKLVRPPMTHLATAYQSLSLDTQPLQDISDADSTNDSRQNLYYHHPSVNINNRQSLLQSGSRISPNATGATDLVANNSNDGNPSSSGAESSPKPVTRAPSLTDPTKQASSVTVGFHRNLPVSIKRIGPRRGRIDDSVRKEVMLMKYARHPKLVEFIGMCFEPHGTYIVEEYCSKGTLADVLANPDIDLTWIFRFSLINDLMDGLDFLQHTRFLHHGLLTSKSCMITGKWELKIGDFGLGKVRREQLDTILQAAVRKVSIDRKFIYSQARVIPDDGSLLWIAPETVVRLEQYGMYITKPSKRADIYSMGVIINEILTRKLPYHERLSEGTDVKKVFEQVQDDDVRPQTVVQGQDEYADKITSIVKDCWKQDPQERTSISVIQSRIKDIDPHLTGSDSVVDNLAILLEKYANDMENLVKKRTANLQQRTLELEEERGRTQKLLKDLKAAKEGAEAAAAAKQNFLANMSHEIRTPMNAVIGLSRILMESDLPPDLCDCAETIESSGNHLMAIIDDILDYSKIESDKLMLENSKVDMSYVIGSAVKLLASSFLDKNLVLWYEVDPNVPVRIYGDLVRLRQIILNLLSNAYKFTKTGFVCVRLKLEEPETTIDQPNDREAIEPDLSSKGDTGTKDHNSTEHDSQAESTEERREQEATFLISVQDTGIGIPQNKLNYLFQSFSQVDASTTRNFGGTGLGLAISRRLCHMMGGDMWVESEYGKGSTFYARVVVEVQDGSPTYGQQNHIEALAKYCPRPVIVTRNPIRQNAWVQILRSVGIIGVEAFNYDDIEHQIDKWTMDTLPSVLIIDADYDVIERFGTGPVTSQTVLEKLRGRSELLAHVPILCVKDVRLRPANKTAQPEQSTHRLALIGQSPTPQEEKSNPFDIMHRVVELHKPFKNSKLFDILCSITIPDDTTLTPSSDLLGEDFRMTPHVPTWQQGRHRSNSTISHHDGDKPIDRPSSRVLLNTTRALLVDDNPVNQKVLRYMLDRTGIHTELAQNGRMACDMIMAAIEQDDPYKLVFMDIWMPEMSGLEATAKIRAELSASPIQPYIIAMTACAMQGDKEKFIEGGMNAYVSKPVRKEELDAAVHTYTQLILTDQPPSPEPGDNDSDNTDHGNKMESEPPTTSFEPSFDKPRKDDSPAESS